MLMRSGILVGALLALVGFARASSESPLDSLPLIFEQNLGQTDNSVRFLARASGETVFLTGDGLVLSLRTEAGPTAVKIVFPGAALDSISGVSPLPGHSHYFKGGDPDTWNTYVPHFETVRADEAWDGIAIEFHGNRHRLEYDFIVAPGADPGRIRLRFQSQSAPELGESGDLLLDAGDPELRQERPVAYQTTHGERHTVAVAYSITDGEVAFELADYDTSLPLVIDPIVTFSTFFGGTGFDEARAVALDAGGNVYVAGTAQSADLPTTLGAVQTEYRSDALQGDAFLAKLDPSGSTVLFATYLGGTRGDTATGLAVDTAGNAYLAGYTESTDFPTTFGAFRRSSPGFSAYPDGFVAKLNARGSVLAYSTYLGGTRSAVPNALAIDASGNAYVVGSTDSTNFPVTQGAIRTDACPSLGLGGFVSKLDFYGSSLVYSTLLCGSATDEVTGIAVDAQGAAYVTGYTRSVDFPIAGSAVQPAADPFSKDAFAAKLNPAGSALTYSTYLGGTGDDSGRAIAVDSEGNAYVAGATRSTDLPVSAGAFQSRHADNGLYEDAFVTVLNPTGSAFVYSSYLGGGAIDRATAIAVDANQRVYVAGLTESPDFPVTGERCQTGFGGGSDAFVSGYDSEGSSLLYSLYLGGIGDDEASGIAVDAAGGAVVAGRTASRNFPTTTDALRTAYGNGYRGATDAFVARVDDQPAPSAPCVGLNGIVNGASFLPGPLAPGEIVSIFGDGLGPAQAESFSLTGDHIDVMLAGTQVLFDGEPAPIIATSNGQVNAIVPYSASNKQRTIVQVEYQGQLTPGVSVPVASSSPAVFALDNSGRGQGAVLNQDYSINGPQNATARGSVIQIFATGEGQTSPPGIDGRLAPSSAEELPAPELGVAVTIGGVPAIVQYAGAAPGLVAGLIQVNAYIPLSAPTGSAVPVFVYFGNNASPAGTTVAIK